jgi:protein-S-isoprenylcysteine O-methyltransferase Ste14
VFVLSLLYFAFRYTVTFAVPALEGNAVTAIAINVVLFSVFALHHSLFARGGFKAWAARTFQPDMERSAYVWLASALFYAVCGFWQPVPGVAWDAEGALGWTLLALQLFGVWLTLRSAAILDFRELAGIKVADRKGPPHETMEFKQTGPYGWVRHPIYTGWFLIVWTAVPMTNTRLVFALVSCFYLLIAIPFEERSMRALPGGSYERYANAVRWKLLPRVF